MGGCCSNQAWGLKAPNFNFEGNEFNNEESSILFRQFASYAKHSKVLTLEPRSFGRDSTFRLAFPYFEDHPKLEKAFFHVFTEKNQITFEDYVRVLSTMNFGTPAEKARLVTRILDVNEDCFVEKHELVRFINAINDSLKKRKDFTLMNAEAVANTIFAPTFSEEEGTLNDTVASKAKQVQLHRFSTDLSQKPADMLDEDEKKAFCSVTKDNEPDRLDYKTFLLHAKRVPEFGTCFGLGVAIYNDKIKPILEQAEDADIHEGYLSSPVWGTRFAVVANGFLTFFDEKDIEQKDPLDIFRLLEAHVRWEVKKPGDEKKFLVSTERETRMFEAASAQEAKQWVTAIRLNGSANPPHRFNAFAPVHANVGSHYFINGKEYFDDLIKNIKHAKHSIYITGWHLTAQLYLSRHIDGEADNRLDGLLLERAEAGVKIRVLIWNEVELAFKLASEEASRILNGLHDNIQVLRDPEGLERHLTLWSQHQKTVIIDSAVGFCGGIDIALGRWENGEYLLLDEDAKLWPGLDYVNPMAGYGKYSGDTLNSYQDRSMVPRMPWHDMHMKVVGAPAMDLERNFIERWEAVRDNPKWIIVPSKRPREPAVDQGLLHPKCNVQILRSVGDWSFKFSETEHSMYSAQLHAIKHSKRFIYIENQFFLSASDSNMENPKNLLLQALIDRVVQAHSKKEDFRVIILTPCQASSDMNTTVTRTLTFWQYASSYRGVLGFWHVLKERGVLDVDKYIYMSSLRNYGRTSNKDIVTEMIYVHSKFMIVDDDIAFICSHNINDRSMLGSRDSEIGAMVQDQETEEVTFGAKTGESKITLQCGRFAHHMRVKIFRTLLDLKPEDKEYDLVKDPIDAVELWKERCRSNTEVYIDVFKYIHNTIESLNDLHRITTYNLKERDFVPNSDEDYEKLQNGVKGFVTDFPRDFLKDDWVYPAVIPGFDAFFV